MIKDLVGAGKVVREADIVIVGAGTVGLVMSVLLSRNSKLSIICLESGGMHQNEEEHPLNEVIHTKSVYSGAASGRFRCIGGTSTRWGGALIPFMDSDLASSIWPITMKDLEPYIPQVEKLFSLAEGPYELGELLSENNSTHTPRLAKWPPFKKRNVYSLLSQHCNHTDHAEIWINATATNFTTRSNILNSIKAQAPDGSEITVSAKSIIISAGAIETTRLALLINKQNNNVISSCSPSLGRYFSDHLSVEVAELEVTAPKKLNKIVGFRFEKSGVMRNLRFELANGSTTRSKIPPCFAHIAFTTDGTGGFDALRDALRNLQRRKLPSTKVLLQLVKSLPWLLKAMWWRFIEKRLLFPSGAKLMVHMVIEQDPNIENTITLSEDRTDKFGHALAKINWSVTNKDINNLTGSVDAFESMWGNSDLSNLATFKRRPLGQAENELALGGGIYHPTGSTRMGATAQEGVVDSKLRMFALPNVYLVSTSVLPSGGGANPTMMLFLLAMRCIDQLSKK